MMSTKFSKIFTRANSWVFAVILVGSFTWSMTVVRSGLCWGGSCANGIGFWGANGHDGVWHLALIESLARGSWEMPIFPGESISNYHIGYDLLVAILHKITFIPVSILLFQIVPVVLAMSLGVFVHLFVKNWTGSRVASAWALFFVYFGGSMGWVVNLLRSRTIDGESLFWSQQSISTLINPPFALSLVVIFAGLWSLGKGVEKKDKKYLFTAALLFGLLIQIKAYAGILALGGLAVAGIYEMIARRNFTVFRVFGGAVVISLLIFLPMNAGAQSVVEWRPFWFVHTLFEFPDRFNWPRMASALANYQLAGNWIKYSVAVTVGMMIFMLGNFSVRLLSLFYFWKRRKRINYLDVFVATAIILGIVAPILFVQTGTVWNTIQFLYYSLIFSGLLSGVFVVSWLSRRKSQVTKYIIATFVIAITIPTTLATLYYHYLPSRPPAILSQSEYEALEFLSSQPTGVVLTQPFDRQAALDAQSNPPRPLYLYESSAYVSAYSKKPVHLEDEVNLNITGYDWQDRRQNIEKFFDNPINEYLDMNNIDYIYLVKNKPQTIDDSGYKKLFENEEVVILKV